VRAPQDAEIVIAIVAGQLAAGLVASEGDYSAKDVVDQATAIVAEVVRQGD
jgi:hypothetical protein